LTQIVQPVLTRKVTKLVCDRCGHEGYIGESGSEFLSRHDTGGYFSRHDGSKIDIDLCEDCTFELLSNWIKVTPEEVYEQIDSSLEDSNDPIPF
jgi:hypothetical protein